MLTAAAAASQLACDAAVTVGKLPPALAFPMTWETFNKGTTCSLQLLPPHNLLVVCLLVCWLGRETVSHVDLIRGALLGQVPLLDMPARCRHLLDTPAGSALPISVMKVATQYGRTRHTTDVPATASVSYCHTHCSYSGAWIATAYVCKSKIMPLTKPRRSHIIGTSKWVSAGLLNAQTLLSKAAETAADLELQLPPLNTPLVLQRTLLELGMPQVRLQPSPLNFCQGARRFLMATITLCKSAAWRLYC